MVERMIELGVDFDHEDKTGRQFIDYLNGKNKKIILEKYPEKCEYYLSGNSYAIKQEMGKYNL